MSAPHFAGATLRAASVEDLPSVYLYPGQIFASSEPAVVSTILGSCVAVCLRDADSGVGGINHFLLPSNPMRATADARYGDAAMVRLLEAVLERGALKRRLVAKIVGGAAVLKGPSSGKQSIGDQNVLVAREFLRRHDIAIDGDQTGGRRGRKLIFHTADGSAFVKEI